MDIGAFILGILFGWLIEWVYMNFFASKGSDVSDCSAFERELKTRNEEIKSLKEQLGVTSGAGKSLMSESAGGASASNTSTAKAESTATASSVSNASSSASPAQKSAASKTAADKKPATTKAKSTANKTGSKSATKAKKTTPKKVAPKKAASSKKSSVAKSSPKKTGAKKIALKKNIGNKTGGDDFTKLSGIGPSMAAKLNELGISSYEKLAAMDDDILRDMLETSGARLNNNKEAMDTWNEQATLAAKGDFEGLKVLQETLKK